MNRRGFLGGVLGLLAAPALVRASSLMPISTAPAELVRGEVHGCVFKERIPATGWNSCPAGRYGTLDWDALLRARNHLARHAIRPDENGCYAVVLHPYMVADLRRPPTLIERLSWMFDA